MDRIAPKASHIRVAAPFFAAIADRAAVADGKRAAPLGGPAAAHPQQAYTYQPQAAAAAPYDT